MVACTCIANNWEWGPCSSSKVYFALNKTISLELLIMVGGCGWACVQRQHNLFLSLFPVLQGCFWTYPILLLVAAISYLWKDFLLDGIESFTCVLYLFQALIYFLFLDDIQYDAPEKIGQGHSSRGWMSIVGADIGSPCLQNKINFIWMLAVIDHKVS